MKKVICLFKVILKPSCVTVKAYLKEEGLAIVAGACLFSGFWYCIFDMMGA